MYNVHKLQGIVYEVLYTVVESCGTKQIKDTKLLALGNKILL